MTSSTEQAAAAGALFKDRTGEILPVIKSFEGDLPGLIAKLRDLGLIMSEDGVRAGDEFGDQMDTLNRQLAAVGRTIGEELMPVFTEMAQEVSAWLQANRGEITAWANGIISAFSLIRAGASNLKASLDDLDDFLRTFFEGGTWQDYHDKVAARAESRIISSEQLGFAKEQAAFEREMDRYRREMARLKRISEGSSGGFDDDDAKKKGRVSAGDTRTDRQAYLDFIAELKKLGVAINSGFRTFEQQKRLFESLPKGQAARPGTSDHEFYRGIDLPAGVKQTLLAQAARAAGVVLEKSFVHEGTGTHRHVAFRKGTATGGGEEDLAKELEKEQKDQEKKDKEAADTAIKLERDTMAERLSVFESGQKLRAAAAKDAAYDEALTASELASKLQALEAETRAKRVELLKEYIDFLRQAGPEAIDELLKAETKLKLLEDDIEASRVENFTEQKKRWAEEAKADADKAIRAQEEWEKEQERNEIRASQSVTPIGEELPGLTNPRADEEDDPFFHWTESWKNFFNLIEETAPTLGETLGGVAGILQNAFQGFANAIGNVVQQWVLYGNTGPAVMRKILAAALASIAAEAAVRAIWELALGFATLFFNPAESVAHFTAAALFGSISVGAALAGRAVAGNAFKQQTTASAGASTGSGGGNRSTSAQGGYYSSQGDEVQVRDQGRNTPGIPLRVTVSDDSTWLGKMLKFEIENNTGVRSLIRGVAEA
jgi:hypothetical protein